MLDSRESSSAAVSWRELGDTSFTRISTILQKAGSGAIGTSVSIPPTAGMAVGNRRAWDIDYRLKSLPGDRTQLTLRGRRTPLLLGPKNPPKAKLQKNLTQSWQKFARALEADYRKSRRKR